mgnify:CR=1 FL=1
MKQKYLYRCLLIANNDAKMWKFVEAYSFKQAEMLVKKRHGWHNKVHLTEVVKPIKNKFTQLKLF